MTGVQTCALPISFHRNDINSLPKLCRGTTPHRPLSPPANRATIPVVHPVLKPIRTHHRRGNQPHRWKRGWLSSTETNLPLKTPTTTQLCPKQDTHPKCKIPPSQKGRNPCIKFLPRYLSREPPSQKTPQGPLKPSLPTATPDSNNQSYNYGQVPPMELQRLPCEL